MPGTSSGAGTSTPTSPFDGGGMTGTASGACASIGSSSLAGPVASAPLGGGMGSGSSVGRVGIPLGSTEMGGGGLSPPSVALTTNPLALSLLKNELKVKQEREASPSHAARRGQIR